MAGRGNAYGDPLLAHLLPGTKVADQAPRNPSFLPGERRHPGRPHYLDPGVEEKFMAALDAGNSIKDAAEYAGLKPKTVEQWISRGRGMMPSRPATRDYVRFARLVTQSRATAKVIVVGNLLARSRVDTRAAELWLRHVDPEWRDEEPEASAIGTREQMTNVVVLSPEEVPGIVHQLLEARRVAQLPEPEIVTEEPRRHDPSRAREAGLREDG